MTVDQALEVFVLMLAYAGVIWHIADRWDKRVNDARWHLNGPYDQERDR